MSSGRKIKDIVASRLRKYGIPMIFAEDIIKYLELVSSHVRVTGVILYGSVAYGKPNISSDIDIIVVSPDFDRSPEELFLLRRKISARRPSRISSIWLGEKEIVKVFGAFSGFLLDALYYGIILYDENGVLKSLKKRLERALRLGYVERRLGMWRIPIEKGIREIRI